MEFLVISLISLVGVYASMKLLICYMLSIDCDAYQRYSKKWWFKLFL